MGNTSLFEKKSIFDKIAIIKREQAIAKKSYSNIFLQKLEDIIEKCFLKPKDKKENFVTKEKLTLELLNLLQTQKKFKDSTLIHDQINNLSVFDYETNLLGRLININIKDKTVEFTTLDNIRNNVVSETKKFNEVDLFDPFSLKMQFYYKQQKTFYDCFSYKESFELLTGKEQKENKQEDIIKYSLGRGIELDKRIKARVDNIDLKD